MWGGVRFLNGYSPIRPAGVAREFDYAIHGEINPEVAQWLLGSESGGNGLLARLGVDGIIVAHEVTGDPLPDSEWQLASETAEGRVFHRQGEVSPRLRSVTSIDSRPNEQFVQASISAIDDRRHSISAIVTVPPGEQSAFVVISRPFFNGYRATVAGRPITIGSYRGLIPVVELPPGVSGRLEMVYCPWWLFWGGGFSLVCLAIFAGGTVLAARRTTAAIL
jgi:hypothetical protein